MRKFLDDLVKKFLRLEQDDKDVNDILSKDTITADRAYRYTRFGEYKSDRKLLKEFFDNVERMVAARNTCGKFFGMMDVDIDIQQFLPSIVNRLMNELGFKVIVMNDDTVIKTGDTETKLNGGGTIIMLLWNRESIKDVKELNPPVVKPEEEHTEPHVQDESTSDTLVLVLPEEESEND
jgi:hypothetical protein